MNFTIRFFLENGMPYVTENMIQILAEEFHIRSDFVREELQRFHISIQPSTFENPFIADYISNGGSVDRSILKYVSQLQYKPKCIRCSRAPGKSCNKNMCSQCCEEDTFKYLHFCSLHTRLYPVP